MTTGKAANRSEADLIAHLESYLGPISRGMRDKSTDVHGIQLSVFENQPCDDARLVITLGLSHHLLGQKIGTPIRQEIFMCLWNSVPTGVMANLLMSLAEEVHAKHLALQRGQVINLNPELHEFSGIEAIYLTYGMLHPEGFDVCRGDDGDIFMVYALPIRKPEADWIAANGWDPFEDMIVDKDPDMLSIERPSLV